MTGLAGIVDDLLASRLHLGTSGRHFADFGDDPGRLADDVAAAVTAWLAERLGSEEVREAVGQAVIVANLERGGETGDHTTNAALAAVVDALGVEGA